jgi:hypothetical protein
MKLSVYATGKFLQRSRIAVAPFDQKLRRRSAWRHNVSIYPRNELGRKRAIRGLASRWLGHRQNKRQIDPAPSGQALAEKKDIFMKGFSLLCRKTIVKRRSTMKHRFMFVREVATLMAGCFVLAGSAGAQSRSPEKLSAMWWEWGFSIPAAQNPQIDSTGANCMVGQRGPIWFLAGVWTGGAATRNCSIPEDKYLFLPVANSVQINAPNVCGDPPGDMTVAQLRHAAAAGLNETNLSVQLDGRPVNDLLHIRSNVFAVALPAQNIFNLATLCGPGGVPAGVYSPAVDEGYYVLLEPLQRGMHTLHVHAAGSVAVDVVYNLNSVPVVDH